MWRTILWVVLLTVLAAPLRAEDAKPASGSPFPPSPVIAGIEWAPADTVVRLAKGGDNWPVTWADDDAQYTAYGDGWGFEPMVEKKLSMGFAKITGGPADFDAVNLRTPTGETVGQGAKGKKASGILCLDGVLYLWVRNAGNSQLALSRDHGKTWEWLDWRFTDSFGCPAFLQFGRDGGGSRDDFVYVYSFDSDSAYIPADRFVLARVPKGKITEREAYEFFVKMDDRGEAVWSPDVKQRGAAMELPGRCYRLHVTYHPQLKRYLMTLPLVDASRAARELRFAGGKTDLRFEGGLAVLDAPEPWGPWTTAYWSEKWDIGPGESANFPAKWISPDGRKLHLVFSGDDFFSVRGAELKLRGPQ